MALTDNLKAFWRLEGNLNDVSGNNKNLVNFGAQNVTFGNIGGVIPAAVFNGNNRLITGGLGTFAGACSISIWFETNGGGSIAGMESNGYLIISTNTTLEVYHSSSFAGEAIPGTYNAKKHLVVTMPNNGSTPIAVYINSVQIATTAVFGAMSALNDPRFGDLSYGAYTGKIGFIGLWNRGLNSGEVVSLYNGGTGRDPTIPDVVARRSSRKLLKGV